MTDYQTITFNGTFRDYQQAVLDDAAQHMDDRKLHVVAAPGSGKTILGLELIRRLDAPALILSPTITIRQQWEQRFASSFLPEGEEPAGYVSFDLSRPSLLTTVTYQALHAAYNRLLLKESGELGDGKEQDFDGFDLLSAVRKAGIRTICLDEAHHLKSEWQKALEGFLEKLGTDVRIIALTATPPYDSTPQEWNRYISLCGEIDEEIFVPQLVAQKTLCPHQDYIYFNYPSVDERAALKAWQEKAADSMECILRDGLLSRLLEAVSLPEGWRRNIDILLDHPEEYAALLCIAARAGINSPKRLVRLLCPTGKLPKFSWEQEERALQFVLDHPEVFGESLVKELHGILSGNSLLERRKVRLRSSEKIDRSLISSIGKLDSIGKIAEAEYANLGEGLRMLVLTDNIRKDMLHVIGTEKSLDAMGTVPVFEAVRRALPDGANVGLLSGGLVVMPDALLRDLQSVAGGMDIPFSSKPLAAGYSEVNFGGANKHKVEVITEVFAQGLLQALVGTKSLLGEGWDSPGINALVLASFVGSYMLSNQMRGRAIRTDRDTPNKTANIWHLVTLEPQALLADKKMDKLAAWMFESDSSPSGKDYATLVRRFDGFMGPAYNNKRIESGIGRIDILKPPFSKKSVEEINSQMLALAADRQGMAAHWQEILDVSVSGHEILEVSEAPRTLRPHGFVYVNAIADFVLGMVAAMVIQLAIRNPMGAPTLQLYLIAALACLMLGAGMLVLTVRILRFFSPEATIRTLSNCLLAALREQNEIQSPSARVAVEADKAGVFVQVSLHSATVREKNVFSHAVAEMLSPIDNPRYVLVKRYSVLGISKLSYASSYACPSVLGTNKERVEALMRQLRQKAGGFTLQYTRSEAGRKMLFQCRRKSYVNANHSLIHGKRKMN